MKLYPDASVLIAAVLNEAAGEAARDLLADDDVDLVASEWTLTEIASALAIKERVGDIDAATRVRALAKVRTLIAESFALQPVNAAQCRRATVFIEHCASALRGGDALHLAIAAAAGATLWTLDRRMAAAGQALGLDVRLVA